MFKTTIHYCECGRAGKKMLWNSGMFKQVVDDKRNDCPKCNYYSWVLINKISTSSMAELKSMNRS